MAKFKVEDYFSHTSVSPTSLTQGQIIQFKYNSPDGIRDGNPLVYVHEKRNDRFYGINLHYNMGHFTDILLNIKTEINKHLQEQYIRVPENREKLRENKNIFSTSLITEEEYKKYMLGFQKRKLEEFLIKNTDYNNMRQYLYSRMNSVTKLVYRYNNNIQFLENKKEKGGWLLN